MNQMSDHAADNTQPADQPSTYVRELTGQTKKKRGPFVMKEPTKDQLREQILALNKLLDEARADRPAVAAVFCLGMFVGICLSAIGFLWPTV